MDLLKDILVMPYFASVDAANIKYTFRFVGFLVDVSFWLILSNSKSRIAQSYGVVESRSQA